jgi:pimeloyl-ACP methyl ester carboxylesterase
MRHVVDIGGAELEAVLEGQGRLTVVFENGLATPLEFWDIVAAEVAKRARVLRYNRRWATPAGPLNHRSHPEIVGDLEKLLTRLAVAPPYVLVGHSWGGVLTRLFAYAHPQDVVGLVFVDATNEALEERTLALLPAVNSVMALLGRAGFVRRGFIRQICPPNAPPRYRAHVEERLLSQTGWAVGLRTTRAESAAIPSALRYLRRECPALPAVPIHVLTAGGVTTKSARRVHEAWRVMAARAAQARYTDVPTSGHYMPIDAPEAVVQAITGVLESSN